jgi:hypothetical protein
MQLLRNLRLLDGGIQVIYDGIDLNRFRIPEKSVDIRSQLGIPETAPCVGFVGKLMH